MHFKFYTVDISASISQISDAFLILNLKLKLALLTLPSKVKTSLPWHDFEKVIHGLDYWISLLIGAGSVRHSLPASSPKFSRLPS